MQVFFEAGFPEVLRPSVNSWLFEFRELLPGWLTELGVAYDQASQDDATNSVRWHYRNSRITLTGKFVSLTPEEQRYAFLHEVAHMYNVPLYATAMDQLNTWLPAGEEDEDPARVALYKALQLRIVHAVEGCNSDLTETFHKLLTSDNDKPLTGLNRRMLDL